jgi:hypothetical protein
MNDGRITIMWGERAALHNDCTVVKVLHHTDHISSLLTSLIPHPFIPSSLHSSPPIPLCRYDVDGLTRSKAWGELGRVDVRDGLKVLRNVKKQLVAKKKFITNLPGCVQ